MDSGALDLNAWIALLSALFAGLAAAAAIGAVVAQYRLFPRPLWVDFSAPIRERDGSISWKIRIANCGNAAAHDVHFVWRNNNTGAEEEHRVDAVLPHGKHFKMKVRGLNDENFRDLTATGAWSVVVRWRQAPSLGRIRTNRFVMVGPIREPGRLVVQSPTLQQRLRRRLTGR